MDGKPGSGDEEVGLTDSQIIQARTLTQAEGIKLGDALRTQRDRAEGLLLIYPISKHSRPQANSQQRMPLFDNPDQDGCTVIGIALVFPDSSSDATIEWVVGSVGELTNGDRDSG